MSRVQNCIRRIINHIISYTCLGSLKIEHQPTGFVSKGEFEQTLIFDKILVLASKHYIAKRITGYLYSKGISYFKRTGSVIHYMCVRKFSNVVLNTSSRSTIIRRMRAQYNLLNEKVEQDSNVDTYKIRATKVGVTKDYIRVLPQVVACKQARYAEFDSITDEETNVDIRYYTSIINSYLRSLCRCMGLPSEEFITTRSNYIPIK